MQIGRYVPESQSESGEPDVSRSLWLTHHKCGVHYHPNSTRGTYIITHMRMWILKRQDDTYYQHCRVVKRVKENNI